MKTKKQKKDFIRKVAANVKKGLLARIAEGYTKSDLAKISKSNGRDIYEALALKPRLPLVIRLIKSEIITKTELYFCVSVSIEERRYIDDRIKKISL